jgi:hypothetical protein
MERQMTAHLQSATGPTVERKKAIGIRVSTVVLIAWALAMLVFAAATQNVGSEAATPRQQTSV